MQRHREWPQMAILHRERARGQQNAGSALMHARTRVGASGLYIRVAIRTSSAYHSSEVVEKRRLVNDLEVAR